MSGWRVFLSHTSELREFPRGMSYVAAVERAISAAGHVIVDMADFPAADQAPAQLCADRVRGCDVYVGLLGTRYGSPVRDNPKMAYTELEFEAATEAGLARLMFLLDADADDVGIPPSQLIDHEFAARQEAFRRRVRNGGLVTGMFASPAALGQLVERSLRELAETRRGARSAENLESDRWHAVSVDMPQAPDRSAVMQRVRELTDSLEGTIDEGTSASLDLMIESWGGAWIAAVESEYVDHCAVISAHSGQAQQQLIHANADAVHEIEKLDQLRRDYLASRQRLTGESSDSAPLGSGPAGRLDWTAPHLVAGRSMVGLILGAVLILAGAVADTVAFQNVLELLLTRETEAVAWAMAICTTCVALFAAGTLGVARAIRRRGRYLPLRYRPSQLPLIMSTALWLAWGWRCS
jgi:hypothetical protein